MIETKSNTAIDAGAKKFYDAAYATPHDPVHEGIFSYGVGDNPVGEGRHSEELRRFIATYGLQDKRVLDVGSGSGGLQDLVADYTGLDLSATARRFYHKPYFEGSATNLPFADDSFDIVWTIGTLEHVPEPELAYKEARRVLKNKGLLYLYPAWQCPPWAADGYAVRPWKDFNWKGKLIKALIPVRDNRFFRACYKIPIRIARLAWHRVPGGRPSRLHYGKLVPNYTYNWTFDSDAVNVLDPFEAMLWFTSRGDRVISSPTAISQILARNAPVVVEIVKNT